MKKVTGIILSISSSTKKTVGLLIAGLVIAVIFSFSINQTNPQSFQRIASTPERGMTTTEQQFLDILNAARAAKGARPLVASNTLTQSAQWMSQDMASHHSLNHTDSQGRGAEQRIPSFGYPIPPNVASENIGYSTLSDAQTIYDGFYNQCDPDASTGACTYGHRTNMLNPQWGAVGVAEVTGGGASFWTTDFGSGLDAPLASSPTVTSGVSPVPTSASSNPTATTVPPIPTTTTTAGPSPTPSALGTPKQISCPAHNAEVTPTPVQVSFNMLSPIYAVANGPITSITLNPGGGWCAWGPANANDPLKGGRCPLACPELNGNTGITPITLSSENTSFSSQFDSYYADNTGSCTYTVACTTGSIPPSATPTPTGEANPSETPAPTPSITGNPTSSPVPSATPIPTSSTPTPTPTAIPAQSLAVKLNVTMPGIGTNTGLGENNAPRHPTRDFQVSLSDAQDKVVANATASLTYGNGSYQGTAAFSNVPSGNYVVKVKSNNSLFKAIPGAQLLTQGQTVDLPQVALITGNLDDTGSSNNVLDLSDYNQMLAGYGASVGKDLLTADLNDDNVIDSKDLNILLRGFATRFGD